MSITFSKRFIAYQILFWSVAILFVGFFLVRQLFNEWHRWRFEPFAEKYLEQPQNELKSRFDAPKESIALPGKLVIVNLDDKKIAPVFNELPKELQPETPEQVKTVLWIKCAPEPHSRYSDGSVANKNRCEMTFIDFANKKYLWRDHVSAFPPERKLSHEKDVIPNPNQTIVDYLKGLPLRF